VKRCGSILPPSKAAIRWLQELFQYHIHDDVLLLFNTSQSLWELRCNGSDNRMTFPTLASNYQLGSQSDLPCSIWIPSREDISYTSFSLHAPGYSKLSEPLVQATDYGLHIGFDIPGFAYWMLARCEEINAQPALLDAHARFRATSSHAHRHGYLERPLVDEWIRLLRVLAAHTWPRLVCKLHCFEIVLSHDVDAPSMYSFSKYHSVLRSSIGKFLKEKNLVEALMPLKIRCSTNRSLHQADPYNTFDWIMNLSETAGVRSSFYFMCGRTHEKHDALYSHDHPAIRSLMRHIYTRGHLIGLHPSYKTYTSPRLLAAEAATLRNIASYEGINQPYWGGRMHYLRWKWPISAYGWQQAGFDYDSSLGYADQPGFRCGTCHPYKMFDPVSQIQLQLTQRPLIAMECSVISDRYLGLGYTEKAFSLLESLQGRCRLVDGKFSLLWHNSHLTTSQDRFLYKKAVLGKNSFVYSSVPG